MATKTWNGSTGTWATAASWSPSGVPAAADDVIINAGSVTVAAQTCGSLTIGGSCIIAGTGLTVTNALNLNSGTLTYSGTAALALNGAVTSAGGTINQNSTGNVTLGGTATINVDFGNGNSFRLLNIVRTTGTCTLINNAINVTGTNSNSSIITFTSGTVVQNVQINCGSFTNTSTTARSWGMNADIYFYVGGNAVGVNWNHAGTCTLTSRTGVMRISSVQNSTNNTISFPALAISTAQAANAPNVRLESSGTLWTISGAVNNIAIDGTCTTASAVNVFGTITTNNGYRTFTGFNPTIYNVNNGDTVTQNCGSVGTFGTVTFNCIASTTCTFTINSLYALNITFSGVNCTYNLGVKDDDAQVVALTTSGTMAFSAVGTYNLYNVRSYVTNMTTASTYNCYHYEHNYFTNPPTAGLFTHSAGTLTIKSGYTLTTWSFTSNTGTRTLTFENNSYITTLNNGTLNMGYTTLTSSCAFDSAGFLHQSTGVPAFTGTPSGGPDTAYNLTLYKLCTPSTTTVRNFNIIDGTSITAAATVNVYKNFTGYTSSTMTGLTVTQTLYSGTGFSYTGNTIVAYNHSVASVTMAIPYLVATNITLSGTSTTYNLGVYGTTNVSIATTGTLTLSGTTATYNLNGVRGYNVTMSSTGTYNNYDYQHNGYTTTSSPTAGTITHSAGTLNLKSGYILYTWGFASTAGTRAITFENNSYIQTQWNGTLSVTYTSLTSSCAFDTAGFYHYSTGTWGITVAPASVDAAFNIFTWYTGGPTTSGYVRNWTVNDGTGAAAATTINVLKNFTGYTGTSMAGLTINQYLAGGLTDYTGVALAAYTSSTGSITHNINNLTAVNITLSGTSSTYNMGTTGSVALSTSGTITLSGITATYNLYNVRGYNMTLSSTGTYNCYYYEHNYFTNPPTAGTITHSAGTLVLKYNVNNWAMITWGFTSTTGTRAITFENESYILTQNTGVLNVNYTSLTSICPETDCGFFHASTGAWTIGPAAPATPAAAFNITWNNRCTVNASYVKNLGNWNPRDSYRIGGGLLANTAAITVSVSGNILFTGNAFASGSVQNDSKWQYLALTYWGADASRTSTYSTGYSEFGEGGVWRAFGILTFASTFTGSLRLNQYLVAASVVHEGGTLDLNGQQLQATTSYSSTNGTVNKYIINGISTYTDPGIYIAATSGTPWSFAYSNLLISDPKIWIYIRGGTVSHGATARQTASQPSFDLTERVSAYTLAPTTAFQVGGLRINNYTVPTNSVWSINGPAFTVYTGGLTAPAAFTVNILGGGPSSTDICQMSCDNTTFIWPTTRITGKANISNSGWKFKNLYIESGSNVTSSGQSVYVTSSIQSSDVGSGILNITGSTWYLYGANPIIGGLQSTGFGFGTTDVTGILSFEGLNGTNLGDQTAYFYYGYGGRIYNNISYNTSTGVGVLLMYAGFGTNQNAAMITQFDSGYTTSKTVFGCDFIPGGGVPVKGSGMNFGTSSAGYRYIGAQGGNWGGGGLKNVESSSIVSGDYLNISGPASGGGGWYAGTHSVNSGASGWIFTDPPTYQLSSSTASVNEGAVLTITLATTNLSNGATVAYTITGVTSADISGASLTGNFTINSGTASLVLNIANDYLTEGNETLTLALNNGAASIAVTIIDTSLTRTYSLSRSAASVTEGSTFTITLTTTNVANSTLVPYTISGTGLTTNDFAALQSGWTSQGTWSASTAYSINNVVIYLGNMYVAISSSTNKAPSTNIGTYWNSLVGSFTGNFTITSNTNAITFLTNWDYSPESTETLTLALDNGLSTVSVDIANLLNPTYALSTNQLSLNEGGNFIITLTTTDVPNNTLVPYTITGVSSADINGASLTGNFTVNSNTASATFTVTADYVTEGDETFVLTLNTIGTSVSVLLIDYTKTRTYSLSTDATGTVYEGGSFTITLTTTNVFDGTLVPYTITGVTSADINNASLTGNFTINTNTGSQSFTTTIDGIVEGIETFTLTLGSPATGSINVAISDPVTAGSGNGLLLFN